MIYAFKDLKGKLKVGMKVKRVGTQMGKPNMTGRSYAEVKTFYPLKAAAPVPVDPAAPPFVG